MTINSRIGVTEALSIGKARRPDRHRRIELARLQELPLCVGHRPGQVRTAQGRRCLCKCSRRVVGCSVAAAKQANTAVELADKLQPFPQNRAKIDKYIDTLNEYLRPRVAVSHHWYIDSGRSAADGDNYYLVIEVEPIPEIQRHVIVRRTLNDKEMLIEDLAIPIRHGGRTIYLPSEDAYQLINGGLRARDGAYFIAADPSSQSTVDVDRSIDMLEQLQDWVETPVLLLRGQPRQLETA